MEYQDKTDEELVAFIQNNGDEFALSELIKRYQQKFYFYIQKLSASSDDADDLVQETFLKIYQNIQSFDLDKKFSSWAYRIAHNLTINHLKKHSRLKLVEAHTLDWLEDHHQEVEDFIAADDRNKLAGELVGLLDFIRPEYKEVVLLYYFQEKSYEEISDILQIPESTVGVWLKRARMKLKELLNKNDQPRNN